jgi:trimeric autotransporter adhesin
VFHSSLTEPKGILMQKKVIALAVAVMISGGAFADTLTASGTSAPLTAGAPTGVSQTGTISYDIQNPESGVTTRFTYDLDAGAWSVPAGSTWVATAPGQFVDTAAGAGAALSLNIPTFAAPTNDTDGAPVLDPTAPVSSTGFNSPTNSSLLGIGSIVTGSTTSTAQETQNYIPEPDPLDYEMTFASLATPVISTAPVSASTTPSSLQGPAGTFATNNVTVTSAQGPVTTGSYTVSGTDPDNLAVQGSRAAWSSTGLSFDTIGGTATADAVTGDITASPVVTGTTFKVEAATGNTEVGGTLDVAGLATLSGGASISGGLNNNNGGITNAGAVSGVTTLNVSQLATLSGGVATNGGNITTSGGTINTGSGNITTTGDVAAARVVGNGANGQLVLKGGTNSSSLTLTNNVATLAVGTATTPERNAIVVTGFVSGAGEGATTDTTIAIGGNSNTSTTITSGTTTIGTSIAGSTVSGNRVIVDSASARLVSVNNNNRVEVNNSGTNVYGSLTANNAATVEGDFTASTNAYLGGGTGTEVEVAAGTRVDMGRNQVHNVANGTSTYDAVNYGQLMDVRKEARRGVANASALAGLPALEAGKQYNFGVGVGHYKGESALSLGGHARINADTVAKFGVGFSGSDAAVSAGIGWSF